MAIGDIKVFKEVSGGVYDEHILSEADIAELGGGGGDYEHPTGFTNQPVTVLSDASVIRQITINNEGHVTGVSTRNLTAANVGAAASSHTHATLTCGTGLTGSNYNGGTAQTWAVSYGTTSGTACQGNDGRLPTTTEKQALAGTGTPSSAIRYATASYGTADPSGGNNGDVYFQYE